MRELGGAVASSARLAKDKPKDSIFCNATLALLIKGKLLEILSIGNIK